MTPAAEACENTQTKARCSATLVKWSWWPCGQTDLRGLEAAAAGSAAARPLRRSAWSPAPRSRGSLPSSSGLTGRVLARQSTARSWSSLKMSHLPTNFCLPSLSQGHSAINELVSFRRLTNPPADRRPLFLPGAVPAKVALQLRGKSAGPTRRPEPQRRPFSAYSEPLGAEVRLNGTKGRLGPVFVLRLSLLSPELLSQLLLTRVTRQFQQWRQQTQHGGRARTRTHGNATNGSIPCFQRMV